MRLSRDSELSARLFLQTAGLFGHCKRGHKHRSAQAAVKRRACRNSGQGKGVLPRKKKGECHLKTIYVIEQILAVLFITCYAYQLFYLAYMLVKKPARAPMASRKHRFGVVICARNEENVIGQLLASVKAQDYPQ